MLKSAVAFFDEESIRYAAIGAVAFSTFIMEDSTKNVDFVMEDRALTMNFMRRLSNSLNKSGLRTLGLRVLDVGFGYELGQAVAVCEGVYIGVEVFPCVYRRPLHLFKVERVERWGLTFHVIAIHDWAAAKLSSPNWLSIRDRDRLLLFLERRGVEDLWKTAQRIAELGLRPQASRNLKELSKHVSSDKLPLIHEIVKEVG